MATETKSDTKQVTVVSATPVDGEKVSEMPSSVSARPSRTCVNECNEIAIGVLCRYDLWWL
jgi:hypothetical protein